MPNESATAPQSASIAASANIHLPKGASGVVPRWIHARLSLAGVATGAAGAGAATAGDFAETRAALPVRCSFSATAIAAPAPATLATTGAAGLGAIADFNCSTGRAEPVTPTSG